MKKIVIIFAIIAAVSSELMPIEKLNDYLPLITGGSPSSPGQFPYQVGVVVMNQTNFEICSGVLIKHKWVLTLASCLQMKFTNYMVAFGTNNLVDDDYPLIFNSTEASNLNIHPNYNSVTNVNNIALIKLEYMPANITDHKNIDYLGIPTADEAKTNLTGCDIVISGYGLTRDVPELDLILHHTTVRLAPNDVCKNFEFDLGGRYNVTDSTLCIDTTGGKSPCMDGGGPMTTEIGSKKVLVGIIGFGTYPCTIGNPATGESVFYHREWIEKTSGSSEVVVSFSIFAVVVMMAVKNLF